MHSEVAQPQSGSPSIAVLSSLFPSDAQPGAGLFIRERMFRVAGRARLVVISPQPWFPLQSLIRLVKPNYRPPRPHRAVQQGITVYCPRFFSMPGVLRHLDGYFMALACRGLLKRLQAERDINVIDAHFAYPDGYAATCLGRWFGLPVTITLRGTEVPLAREPKRRQRMLDAIASAERVFSVSQSLLDHVVRLGARSEKLEVVGNGVDTECFYPVDQTEAREALDIPADAKVVITVGGLVERKGFHRVIDAIPALRRQFPNLIYLVVGGPSAEGDWTERLHSQVEQLGLQEHVRFLGPIAPSELRMPLSAADLFVLSTRNEGWANVILESMACGRPVIATDVGGNAEVVSNARLGTIVPFNDPDALQDAMAQGLETAWDREEIIEYAKSNSWDTRVEQLDRAFRQIVSHGASSPS
ncbi:MAG: glycosyltransferase [Pseudomonadota bacterium]